MRLCALVQFIGRGEWAQEHFRTRLFVIGIFQQWNGAASQFARTIKRDEPADGNSFKIRVAEIFAFGVMDEGLQHHRAPPSCFFISAQSGTLTTPSLSWASKKVMRGSGVSTFPGGRSLATSRLNTS